MVLGEMVSRDVGLLLPVICDFLRELEIEIRFMSCFLLTVIVTVVDQVNRRWHDSFIDLTLDFCRASSSSP